MATFILMLVCAYIASQVVIVLFFALVYIARTRQERDDGPTL